MPISVEVNSSWRCTACGTSQSKPASRAQPSLMAKPLDNGNIATAFIGRRNSAGPSALTNNIE